MHIAALNGHPETAHMLFKKGVPLLMPNKVCSTFRDKGIKFDVINFSDFSSFSLSLFSLLWKLDTGTGLAAYLVRFIDAKIVKILDATSRILQK